ncbi:serine/threonine-protein kinase [Micromonospora sp. C28SCA-DRY-2]|uniref:serine/threonine-protein kinase n=1 Tax=Micromonospora sp. C28SCA-DRY-2 TaxID=3059522 RepID=UPI0026746086|nr:serine/threonine-protein kinase [Micromonospora sp. C28SCA-DRY-2]MDO3704143.1 serine/threonine-protein kinase [Micromonospora sp. C28SCA-DRY-2]
MTAPVRIGSYRIERLLGAGSFATVWLGHDPVLDSRVAVKVLAENWSHDLRVRERFLDEARLLRRLDHDRVVRVHAVGELPDGRPYAVLAWADGGSLRDRLARGPLPVVSAVDLLGEIAAGVAVLHRHGVVHRDLTPGNILFRSTPAGERVLVADLGLAKALAAASGLTARAGTPGYMAPEQDDPLAVVDTRADVFGLGRLGVRLLCAAAERPGAPVRPRPGVPPAVTAVLRRATARRPADRYPDAAAFRAALCAAAAPPGGAGGAAARRDGSGGTAPADPASEVSGGRRGGRRRAGLVGAGVLALVALGFAAGDGAAPPRPGAATAGSGPVTVTLPPGWRADGTGWAGRYGDDGDLEPALVVSPDPARWAADPSLPGAFVGLSASTARRTGAEGFLAERPHADCAAAPVRRTRQGGVDWVVAGYACPRGRPVIVEAAGTTPAGLLYVQVVPPPGAGPAFVDGLLAGVRVRPPND